MHIINPPIKTDQKKIIWKPLDTIISNIPYSLIPWLTDSSSLTDKLKKMYHCPPTIKILNFEKEERLFIRDSLLCIQNTPKIYANCIFFMDNEICKKNYKNIQSTIPIGSWLFTYSHLQRSDFHITLVPHHYLPLEIHSICPPAVWGRRSLFSINHDPITLITEYFIINEI